MKLYPILKDQLARASSSVVLNISEGSGRRTPADQRRCFAIAFGSLQECRAILDIENIKNDKAAKIADELAAILYVLSRKK